MERPADAAARVTSTATASHAAKTAQWSGSFDSHGTRRAANASSDSRADVGLPGNVRHLAPEATAASRNHRTRRRDQFHESGWPTAAKHGGWPEASSRNAAAATRAESKWKFGNLPAISHG